MKLHQRGNTIFKINPISSSFEEDIQIGNDMVLFGSKRTRFFNQSYCSDAKIENNLNLSIVHKFKSIEIYDEKLISSYLVIPPKLFPFFSIGDFKIDFPEGQMIITIPRDSDKISYGRILFSGKEYRYMYKQFYYKSDVFLNMFPDSLPEILSKRSGSALMLFCLWLNAYNAS
jgi:hypothetical protein